MSFPQYGKNISAFSTLWKNIFHSVDSGGASAPTHNVSVLGTRHLVAGTQQRLVGILYSFVL